VRDGERSKAGVLRPAVNEAAQVKKETIRRIRTFNSPRDFAANKNHKTTKSATKREREREREKKTVLLAMNETARVEKKTEDLNRKMRRIRTRNCPTAFTTPDEEEEEEEQQQKQEQTQSATRERERERERAKQAGVATLARRSGIREFQQRTIIGEEGA
jgi:hypothetical protein